jgi:tRNA-dihydrouridine synthase 1
MVDHSELAFRVLCRRHGATLAYTPMLHAKNFAASKKVRAHSFDPAPGRVDRPLIAQFAGCDAATLIIAAKYVEGQVDAVDLNFGCPQKIAHRGGYGSFLLERDWDWLVGMVATVAAALAVPLTIKLRLVMDEAGAPSIERTIELCLRLERAGVSLITLHGRTRREVNRAQHAANWEAIGAVRRALRIPLVANGGVYTRADADACLAATGAAAVMSAEGLLENPALFAAEGAPLEALVAEYIELARAYPPRCLRPVRGHLFKMLYAEVTAHTALARTVQMATTFDALILAVDELIAARHARRGDRHAGVEDLLLESWYHRHRMHAARALPGVSTADGAGDGGEIEVEGELAHTAARLGSVSDTDDDR